MNPRCYCSYPNGPHTVDCLNTAAREADRARETMAKALDAVIEKAIALVEAFDNDEGAIEKYPAYLPSYDEHVHDLMTWRDAIRAQTVA